MDDGDLDAVVGETKRQSESTYQNTGYSIYKRWVHTSKLPAATIPLMALMWGFNSTPTFADLDGDGDLDAPGRGTKRQAELLRKP